MDGGQLFDDVSGSVFLLTQVSVVGVVRSSAHYDTNVQYCVDDMTGPPLLVKQWVGEEASRHTEFYAPTAETVS